jgi:hypothetical protein
MLLDQRRVLERSIPTVANGARSARVNATAVSEGCRVSPARTAIVADRPDASDVALSRAAAVACLPRRRRPFCSLRVGSRAPIRAGEPHQKDRRSPDRSISVLPLA